MWEKEPNLNLVLPLIHIASQYASVPSSWKGCDIVLELLMTGRRGLGWTSLEGCWHRELTDSGKDRGPASRQDRFGDPGSSGAICVGHILIGMILLWSSLCLGDLTLSPGIQRESDCSHLGYLLSSWDSQWLGKKQFPTGKAGMFLNSYRLFIFKMSLFSHVVSQGTRDISC